MKKTFLPILLLFFVFASCKETEDPVLACGVADPVKNLSWLNEMINEIESSDFADNSFLVMSTYQNQTVFFVNYCCINCLSVAPIYLNCEGNIIEAEGIGNQLENSQVIWKSKNSTCNFD